MAISLQDALSRSPPGLNGSDTWYFPTHKMLDRYDGAMERLQDPEYRALSPADASRALEIAKDIQKLCTRIRSETNMHEGVMIKCYLLLENHLKAFLRHDKILRDLYGDRAPIQDI